jgi:hypothetical protein
MGMLPTADPRRQEFEKATANARAAGEKANAARQHVEALRQASAPKIDARTALKTAIAAAKKTQLAAAKNLKAIEAADTMVYRARDATEAAPAALAKAREEDARSAARIATGNGKAPPQSAMQKARAEEQIAVDRLAAAEDARSALRDKQGLLELSARTAQEKLNQAIDAVLAAELPVTRWVKEGTVLQEELMRVRLKLRHALAEKLIGDKATREAAASLLNRALPREQSMDQGYVDWSKHPAAVAWEELRTKLATDADAVIEL